jgi:pentose-5-phosphate-3-epimerase
LEIIIAPSLPASGHARFGDGAERAGPSAANWLHPGMMNGHFATDISFGPIVATATDSSYTYGMMKIHRPVRIPTP